MAFKTWGGGRGLQESLGKGFSLRPSNLIETKSIHFATLFSDNLKIIVVF